MPIIHVKESLGIRIRISSSIVYSLVLLPHQTHTNKQSETLRTQQTGHDPRDDDCEDETTESPSQQTAASAEAPAFAVPVEPSVAGMSFSCGDVRDVPTD